MPLELYASYSGGTVSNPIATILATLSNSGTQFACPTKPAEVRIFKTGAPYGELLTEDTTNPSSPAAGKWGYSGGMVKLGTALQNGETAVAISSGVKLFETQTTQNNKLMFIANSSDPKDKTKIQTVYLKNTDTNKQHVEISITFQDFLASEGASTSWCTISEDGTNYSASLSIASMAPGAVKTLYVKAVVPDNQQTLNYRDIYLKIESIEVSIL